MEVRKEINFPIRLAIIGAGAAGLAVARNSLSSPSQFETTIFEQADQLGGIWVYKEMSTNTAMYQNLRTNLPKEIMAYLDYSFPEKNQSFLSHMEVLKYLQDYAHHYNISPNIKFATKVISISPSEKSNWEIEVESNDQRAIYQFDAVAICSGHFSKPRIPSIPDLDKFQGQIMHSHAYRKPNCFTGLRVVCLGAGPSGVDISADIAKTASKVYLSHNKEIKFTRGDNIQDVAGVLTAKPTGFCLKDGSFIECDALMFCTGYAYSIPFVSSKCDVTVNDNYLFPLYKHMINAHRPSMAFIGLLFTVVPFPLADYQARFFLHCLLGKINIPSASVIESENKRQLDVLESKKTSLRFVYRLDDLQWDYYTDLALEIGCKPPKPVLRKIYKHVKSLRFADPSRFRNISYKIVNSELFNTLECETES